MSKNNFFIVILQRFVYELRIMIKTIIFDLGGVLIDVDMPYCLNNIKALGVDVEALTKSSATAPASTVCEGR